MQAIPVILALCGATLLSLGRAQPSSIELTAITPGASGASIFWSDAGAGYDYTVQIRETVAGGIWRAPRASVPWPIADRQWLDPAFPDTSARFYRVAAVPKAERGKLLGVQELPSWPASQINLGLLFAGVPLKVTYDVRVYKLTYETVDPWGARTVASGLLALPQQTGRALPLCSYQHGTIAKRTDAPSTNPNPNASERFLGVVMAGSGYAAVLPDYLGLGDSTGIHPYHHAASEATAAVDLLRAARARCASQAVSLNGQLFLLGYSQGGHATMALHREIEEYHPTEFSIVASAPMAGAYDLSGVTTDDALSGRPMPNPYYFVLFLASYQSVYHLAGSLAEMLAPPYNTTVPPLLDGNHTGDEIDAVLPSDGDITKVLKPELLAALRKEPNHPLRQALRDNDLYRWTPKAPMQMFHCDGDRDVIIANSQVALASFHSRGALQVQLHNPQPGADHGGCTFPSMLQAKAWFDTLRQ